MKHLKENNETYFSHLRFAGTIGLQLILRGVVLVFHGIFPFWLQPESFSLSSTCKKIQRWNDYAQRRKKK